MIVLLATQNQYNSLNNYTNGNDKLLFAKDAQGRWIVGVEILDNENYSEIKPELSKLEQIEFLPITIQS